MTWLAEDRVDGVGLVTGRGLQLVERPDSKDAIPDHRDGLRRWLRRVQRDDLPGRVDDNLRKGRGGLREVLKRSLLRPRVARGEQRARGDREGGHATVVWRRFLLHLRVLSLSPRTRQSG